MYDGESPGIPHFIADLFQGFCMKHLDDSIVYHQFFQLISEGDIVLSFTSQVVHYHIQTSLFDIVVSNFYYQV